MSNSEESEENTKVPGTSILGECTGLGVEEGGKKEKYRRNNWRMYVKVHREESIKSRRTQHRVMAVMGASQRFGKLPLLWIHGN